METLIVKVGWKIDDVMFDTKAESQWIRAKESEEYFFFQKHTKKSNNIKNGNNE